MAELDPLKRKPQGMVLGEPPDTPAQIPTGGMPAAFASAPVARPLAPVNTPLVRTPPVPETPNSQEWNRLNAPPLPATVPRFNDQGAYLRDQANPLAHTSADTGLAGVDQIHRPGLRWPLKILSGIGDAILPQLTMNLPGTQLHHELLVHQRGKDVAMDEERANNASKRGLEGAQTRKQNDEANDLENPQPAAQKTGDPTKTIETAEGIMQFNPASGRYDIPAGKAPASPDKAPQPYADWRKQNPDAPVENWIKLQRPEVHGEYEDFKAAYHQNHPQSTDEDVVKAYATAHKPPATPADHGVTMIGPDGQVLRLTPGQTAPTGVQTPNQAGAANSPTLKMRDIAAQSQLVHEQTPHMLSEIDRLKGKLGPMAGRWNDVMQGKIGTNDPDFAGLRADLLMYSSAVALMHARGRLPENLREEFDHTINNPSQDFGNLKAVISRIDDWTTKNMSIMSGRQAASTAPGAPPTVTTKEQFDALPKGAEYMEDGKKYRKP